MEDPILRYTIPTRLLLVAMIVFAIGGTGVSIFAVHESLPAGQYPILVFATPFVLVAFLGFHIGVFLLRNAGVRVRHDDIILPTGFAAQATPDVDPAVISPIQTQPIVENEFCSVCKTDVIVEDDGRCPRCGWPV